MPPIAIFVLAAGAIIGAFIGVEESSTNMTVGAVFGAFVGALLSLLPLMIIFLGLTSATPEEEPYTQVEYQELLPLQDRIYLRMIKGDLHYQTVNSVDSHDSSSCEIIYSDTEIPCAYISKYHYKNNIVRYLLKDTDAKEQFIFVIPTNGLA